MTTTKPRTAYRIETERLVLRCWCPTDAPRWRELLDVSDGFLRPWIPYMKSEPRTPEETVDRLREVRAQFDRDEAHRYGVFSSDESTLIGEVSIFVASRNGMREVGYLLDVRHGGKGYAVEATGALVRVAFEVVRVRHIQINCAVENHRSAAVAEKLGFVHEATLAGRLEDCEGKTHDMMTWSLSADGYPGSPPSAVELRAYDCLRERLV